MSRRRAKKKGVHPLVAVAMLIGCAGYSAWSLFGSSGPGATQVLSDLIGMDAPDPSADESESTEEVVWRDLLAVHGSYDDGVPVRMAFAALVEAAPAAAAPAGEVESAVRWRGQDPPQLRVGVVMVSEQSRRAVLDGRVVGIGDHIAEGMVVGIDPGVVRLRWQQRELTYDLDGTAPREFRAELAMRRAAETGLGAAEPSTEIQEMEEGK
ncbi:MAG: hypothetical protein H6835_11235 [Planctomycetes bacterium]|nr:hypothetical protein [Planctomycetota bacterium]